MEIVKFFSPLPRVPWNGSKGFKRLGTKGTSKGNVYAAQNEMETWHLPEESGCVDYWEKKKKCVCGGGGAIASSFCDLKGQNNSQSSRIFLTWIHVLTFHRTTTETPCVGYSWTVTNRQGWARHCARHCVCKWLYFLDKWGKGMSGARI